MRDHAVEAAPARRREGRQRDEVETGARRRRTEEREGGGSGARGDELERQGERVGGEEGGVCAGTGERERDPRGRWARASGWWRGAVRRWALVLGGFDQDETG